MISETSKWKYQREKERALTYSVLAGNTKNGTKSPFFMICFSLPLSMSSHLRKEKLTHTQLHTQQLKVQKRRNPKYPYQQMKRRNQGNHKEDKFRECKYMWYELREKPKSQTKPLIHIIVEKPSPSKQAKPSLLFQQIECRSVRETWSSFSSAIIDEVSRLLPLSVCHSHPLPSLFLV